MFQDGQFGGVAEDLIEDVGGVAVGGDDDLRAVGGVLVGDVGVAGDALVEEVPRQRPGGQRFAAHRQPKPVGGGQGAASPHLGERVPVVLVDDGGIRRAKGVFA